MFRLFASLALVSILAFFVLLGYSRLYDIPVVHDGPAYPEIERPQSAPITATAAARETKDCFTEAQRIKEMSQQYRSCSETKDCRYMPHGWVSMLAVNKTNAPIVEKLYGDLNQYCDDRQSHDAFYSDYGIEMLCENQLCTMSEITSEKSAKS